MLIVHTGIWLIFLVAQIRTERRMQGEAGRRRLREMDVFEATTCLKGYRARWTGGFLIVLMTNLATTGIVAMFQREWLPGIVALAGVPLAAAAIAARREARPQVLAVLAERDLSQADISREVSQRRSLRVRQFGAVAAVSLLAGTALLAWVDWSPADLIAALLLIVGAVALVGLAWARAWRYGDEQPATP